MMKGVSSSSSSSSAVSNQNRGQSGHGRTSRQLAGSDFSEYKNSVCQIRGNKEFGTGFLVARNAILTCAHVLPSKESARGTYAHFKDRVLVSLNPDENQGGFFHSSATPPLDKGEKGKRDQRNNRIFSEDNLDFTLVAFDDRYGKVKGEPIILPSKSGNAKVGDTIATIHYPQSVVGDDQKTKEIVQDSSDQKVTSSSDCKIKPIGNYLIHYQGKDLGGGSSGAPIFLNGTKELVAFHHGECREHQHSNCRLGVRAYLAYEHIMRNAKCARFIFSNWSLEESLLHSLTTYYEKKLKISILKPKADKKGGPSLLFPIDGIYTQLVILGEEDKKRGTDEIGTQKYDQRLQTYESLFQTKKSVKVEEIFDQEKIRRQKKERVLIYGSAGSGKTTTSFRLASQAKKLWPNCSALFLIRLRNLTEKRYPSRYEGYSVNEVIAKECGLDFAEYQEFLKDKEFRNRAIILFDGYDESSQALREGGSLESLLADFDENFKRIIVTSRPGTYYPPGFKNCLELEIIGFDEENKNLYIDRFFSNAIKDKEKATEKSRALQKSLVRQPLANSLAHTPINLCFICSLTLEGVSLFGDQQALTMSYFYTQMVRWLYKMAQLRFSPEVNLANLQREIDPTKDPKINQLAQILEAVAWQAMDQDTLDIPENELLELSEEKQLQFSDWIDLGLVNCEEGEVYRFAHLTFQEYFAASALARLYLEGRQEKALGKIKEIKFILRYQIVLSMTAGILSLKDKKALQSYFDHLYEEPRDLGQSYELQLFARCFEECVDPEVVGDRYSEFIESALEYFKQANWVALKYRLLNGNHKLLNHSRMKEVIIEGLSKEKQCTSTLQLLNRLAENSNSLPSDILRRLVDICREPGESERNLNSIKIIESLAKSGALSEGKEAQEALINYLRSQETGLAANSARKAAVKALAEMAKSGAPSEGKEAQEALINYLRSQETGLAANSARKAAVKALAEMAKSGAPSEGKEAQEALINYLRSQETGYDANWARYAAVKALAEMAKSGAPSEGKEAQEALINCLRSQETGDAAHSARYAAANALAEMAKSGAPSEGKEAQEALINCLRSQETGYAANWAREAAANALAEMAKSGALSEGKEAQEALINCLRSQETGYAANWAREAAANALAEMAKSGALSEGKEAQEALINCLRNQETGEAANWARDAAANALAEMAKSGAPSEGKEAQEALINCLRSQETGDAAHSAREAAAKALAEMAKSGALSEGKEAQEALINCLRSQETGDAANWARDAAAKALAEMAKSGALSEGKEAQEALINCLRSQETGDAANWARDAAAKALAEMAKSGALSEGKEAQEALINCLRSQETGYDANWARYAAAKALAEMANSGALSEGKEAQEALINCLRSQETGYAANSARKAAVNALPEMAKSGAPSEGKEAQEALINCLRSQETGYDANSARKAAVNALAEMAKSGALSEGKEAQEALINCLRSQETGEAANSARKAAVNALAEMAKSGALSEGKEAQEALINCLRSQETGYDANSARKAAANALAEMAKSGALSEGKEAQEALINCLRSQETGEAANLAREAAANVLKVMSKTTNLLNREACYYSSLPFVSTEGKGKEKETIGKPL